MAQVADKLQPQTEVCKYYTIRLSVWQIKEQVDILPYVQYNVHIGGENMTSTNITNFRKNLFEYVNQAVSYNDIINVTTKDGNVIVMSEEEYNGLIETLALKSTPGMEERLEEGLKATLEDCEDFEW